MMPFWLGVALLTFIAILIVFYPIYRIRGAALTQIEDTREEDNVEVFKDRLEELQQEMNSGSLSKEEFQVLKLELEKNLLIDAQAQPLPLRPPTSVSSKQFALVVLMVMAVPVLALSLYYKLGSAPQVAIAMNLPEDPFEGREPTLDEAIAQLRLELEANPENPEGWYILASTMLNMERYEEGLAAMRKVESLLTPEDPQYASVLGQVAQAMFFAEGAMTPDVRAKIAETLSFEPFEITALGLQGIAAFEEQQYRLAIESWKKALINADGETAASFQNGIVRAREALAEQGEDVSDIEIPQIARIPVSIAVAEPLLAGLAPETPVFVVARPMGGGMPLAAVRLTAGDLPVSLELTDGQSMSPQARLSSVDEVSVSVRISLSGNVQPQSGDMMVEVGPVPTKGVDVPLELLVQEVVQ